MPISSFNNLFLKVTAPLRSAYLHRHLLKEFVTRDIKSRFAGSMGGILWTLINPLVNIAVFIFVFSLVMRIQVSRAETGTDSFALFFLSAYFPWLFFSEGLSHSVGILVGNANLITKVVFPVELLPAGAVLAAFIVNGIGLIVFLAVLCFMGFFHWMWVVILIILPLEFLFVWGLASLTSAICVFLRDMREMLSILLMVWFYATPIIYPVSMIPEKFMVVTLANPMAFFVDAFRMALLAHRFDPFLMLKLVAISFGAYCLGSWFLMRAKPAFGDVL